jgi:hypothetical protein
MLEKEWEYSRITCLHHTCRLQTKPAIRLGGAYSEIAIPAELIILITLHLNAIYSKIPVGKIFVLRFLMRIRKI